ncbi:MAG: hypothetical protein RR440_00320 [Erysipelotrichaceae bacterium]
MKNLITVYKRTHTVAGGRDTFKLTKSHDLGGAVDVLAGGVGQSAMKFVEESTHILICRISDIQIGDWITMNNDLNRVYEVTYSDNPMNRNRNLEVELQYLPNEKIE